MKIKLKIDLIHIIFKHEILITLYIIGKHILMVIMYVIIYLYAMVMYHFSNNYDVI